jgi:signal transduction histidine kinase
MESNELRRPDGFGRRLPQLVVDVVPAAALAALVVAITTAQVHSTSGEHLGVVAYLLLAGTGLALAARRLPWLAYAVSVALTVVYLLLHNPPSIIFLPPFLALVSVMSQTRSMTIWVPAAAAGAAVLAVAHGASNGWSLPVGIFAAVWLGVALVVGVLLEARRRLTAEVTSRAEWARRSREEEARRRTVEERLDIAREMHDVIGHSLAVISLQAGVAEHLLSTRPEETRNAIAAIRRVSKEALTELRAELATLRGDGAAPAERAPTPDLAAIRSLVSQMREAGLSVDLDLTGDARAVPEIVSTAAYRIVQESLTNVVRHAGSGAAASVRAGVVDGRLEVEVVDDGRGMPAQATDAAGLQGMRERALALSGDFAAGNRAGGGFRVFAALPL